MKIRLIDSQGKEVTYFRAWREVGLASSLTVILLSLFFGLGFGLTWALVFPPQYRFYISIGFILLLAVLYFFVYNLCGIIGLKISSEYQLLLKEAGINGVTFFSPFIVSLQTLKFTIWALIVYVVSYGFSPSTSAMAPEFDAWMVVSILSAFCFINTAYLSVQYLKHLMYNRGISVSD